MLWYSRKDIEQFKLDTTLYSDAVRESIFQDQKLLFDHGDFFGNILGLEKYLLTNSYHDRRTRMKTAVFEEQARQRQRQRLPKEEIKTRLMMDGICGAFADNSNSVLRLAKIAEEESRWARERACIIGLALQSHLSL